MASFGCKELGRNRRIGCFQLGPTSFEGGDYADFYLHLYNERNETLRQEDIISFSNLDWPEKVIEFCRVKTGYRPVYRMHSAKHFYSGTNYMANWSLSERNKLRDDRFSPMGTEGYYFGLTLKAAEDEIRHYSRGVIDQEKYLILVIESCFENILYLTAGCIDAVWEVLGLPRPKSLIDMYMMILNPKTDNYETNAIGKWAREVGFEGILYPSARYGQEDWVIERQKQGYTIFPLINFVEIGSHLCHNYLALRHAAYATGKAITLAGGLSKCMPIWAEHNLVLFNGDQVSGKKWGVVYQTFGLEEKELVLSQDDFSRQAKSYFYWGTKERPEWLP